MLYIIRTYLCVSLLSNCTSHEVQVVSLSLQVFLGLFENFKGHLKSELEIFVTTIFLRILESENSSTDHKMRVLEVFLNICRDHILLVEIFVNYDCDFEAIDLFKRIVDGFAKIAKHNPTKLTNELSNLRIMGLEGLVVVLRSLLNSSYFGQVGIDDLMKPLSPDLSKSSAIMPKTYDTGKPIKSPSLSALADDEAGGNVDDIVVNSSVFSSDAVEKFDKKKRIHEEIETGILKFNLSPKKGLAYLVSLGHLEMTAKSVAHFFRQYQDRLDKTVVGEYLGREREYEQGFCIKVLNEYVDSMEFTSMKFDEAIRFFLSGFRLPGEAQKIDRLMEKFAERFYLQNRQDFASADMAFILAFSTIMLQTNLHNPAIKDDKRMTKEQFIKQNKGITPDGELSDELLSEIYDRISLHPISLNKDDAIKQRKIDDAGTLRSLLSSADTKRKEAFSDERREMVKAGEAMFKQKSKLGNTFVHTSKESDEEYVRPMFEVSWAPMIGVFSQILETSESTKQIELCIIGLSYGTRLAGRLDFSIVRHTYMNALAKFTSMESTREVNGKNIECIKALIAVARTEGEYLSESWVDVMRCVSQLDRLAGLVHNMRSEDGSSTASASSAASKKNLSRTADKDTFSKLFLGVSKADSMRIIDESNAELLEDAVDSEDVDHIFLNSRCLSGEAIFVFVQSLCAVSLQEINAPIPRVFLLQKLVEVADFNMGSRPRLDWDRIWNLLASHFTIVGTHKNLQLAMYAVDSLKQLSIKFLQKVELANFNFQRKFLKPFEIILGKTQSFQIKDLVIRCLDIMIQACAINIRSGWRSIFAIFEIAAASEKYEVSALAFEVTERLIKNQFDLLIYDFVELMNCLVAFVSGPHSLLSLSAITHVSTCAFHLANGDVSPALDNQHNFSDPLNISWEKSSHRVEEEAIGEDTSVFRLWWPLLLGLSTRASDPRNEIREQALHSLHKILSMYGHLFSSQTWSVIFKGVLFPMIDSVLTDNSVYVSSTYPSQHPELTDSQRTRNSMGYQVLSVCLSLFHSNRYKAANDVYNLLPELLTLLEDCVCQDSESLSSIGAKALYDFIDGFRSSTGENFLNESAASLVCSTLQSCVTHNLVFDFSEAGALKLKNGDTILSSVSEVEVTPLKRKSTKREVHVKTMYGEGIFVHTMPATGDLPQRHKIRLSHGAMLYTTDDVTDMCSTDVFDDTSVDEQQMMFAPELSYDQAWIQLAVGAMTSMVVTLQLIESIGSLTIKFLSEWNVSHITILLSTLNSCHAHAHAFNHHSALRINLKLAGFMKFPDNAARLPHLLEQEISSLMKILDITTKLYNSANADIKSVVDVWFCRY
jgi:brefeldin A-inhibited guanine nucleotide-exchange protein